MFSFFAKRAEKKRLEKERKKQLEQIEKERKELLEQIGKTQTGQMQVNVVKALNVYLDGLDENRNLNVLTGQKDLVKYSSFEYKTTLFSLEPQINKKI